MSVTTAGEKNVLIHAILNGKNGSLVACQRGFFLNGKVFHRKRAKVIVLDDQALHLISGSVI
ncbi:MAG: hypothetical protein BRD50_05835 [Bacteroidetes bacterium SW_11_45_7]|nr:MAG: hypothetical protein BRD50_05835 [Bacteroidetes bacterium SW_11_45_7]